MTSNFWCPTTKNSKSFTNRYLSRFPHNVFRRHFESSRDEFIYVRFSRCSGYSYFSFFLYPFPCDYSVTATATAVSSQSEQQSDFNPISILRRVLYHWISYRNYHITSMIWWVLKKITSSLEVTIIVQPKNVK